MFDFNPQGNNKNNKNNNNNINDMLSFLGGSSLGGGQKKKFTFFEDDFSKKKSHEDKSQSSFQNSQNNYIFRSFSYQEDKNLKYRQSMEDIGVMLPDFIPEKKYSLFGIFDGHGGNDVVKYIKNRLPEIIKTNITKNNNYDSIENNLTSSFHKIDEELKFYDSEHTGSTATILLFQDNIVYCANVGDSTAFIVYDNFIKKISIDHKCTDPKEEERILLSGGKITKNRVMGQLVLSRCLGDLYCKKYGVSNIPDISVNKLEGNVKYVVVASDGVWDVVKENELLQLSKNRKNAEGFCKDLVKLAIDKDTKDNVSCIVISFDS
jgi:protein phosphatase 1L